MIKHTPSQLVDSYSNSGFNDPYSTHSKSRMKIPRGPRQWRQRRGAPEVFELRKVQRHTTWGGLTTVVATLAEMKNQMNCNSNRYVVNVI